MSLSLTIDLNDQDLAHFTSALKAANQAAAGKSPRTSCRLPQRCWKARSRSRCRLIRERL